MQSELRSPSRAPAMMAVAAALLVGTVACGDDPFAFDWSDAPDTVQLYSLARPELNLVSAFNFLQNLPVRVENPNSTGSWDIAVDTRGGQIVFLPPGALNVGGAARIATLASMSLDDVTQAPSDTLLYVRDQAVPVEMGDVYIIRTNRQAGSFGRSCVYYAKVEAVSIDAGAGTLTFREVTNPVCNDRDLVPPD
ncbi:MAG: hypothetical protein HKN72_17170 [Gemmatimonadetes bacterium]|nr:hypothetical protein [Gemmatimonadota bacterium]NNF14960.1 hypothetical protein [Gemmatimonadota bacterium]NNL30916.1 hypothetical protein [Gemmatimonadota bacterium]